jgi:hypothetical protein
LLSQWQQLHNGRSKLLHVSCWRRKSIISNEGSRREKCDFLKIDCLRQQRKMKIEPPNAQNLFSSLITHTITKLRSRTSGSHMGCGRRAPSRHDPAFGLVGGMDRSIRSGFLFSLATESGERPAEKSQPSPPPATRTYARDTARVYIRMSNRFCSVPRCDVTTHTFCWGSLRFPSKALWTS